MSNHSGSYMINELLHEINSTGLFSHLLDEARVKFIGKVIQIGRSYDCNLAEIIDEELACLLSVCRYCGKTKPEIGKGGYCVACRTEIGEEEEEG